MQRYDEQSNGKIVTVSPGGQVEICLSENPTTGFRWKVLQKGEPVCALLSDNFDAGARVPGQPGIHTWVFNVMAEGPATIEMIYRRAWDTSSSARTFTLHLSARK